MAIGTPATESRERSTLHRSILTAVSTTTRCQPGSAGASAVTAETAATRQELRRRRGSGAQGCDATTLHDGTPPEAPAHFPASCAPARWRVALRVNTCKESLRTRAARRWRRQGSDRTWWRLRAASAASCKGDAAAEQQRDVILLTEAAMSALIRVFERVFDRSMHSLRPCLSAPFARCKTWRTIYFSMFKRIT